MLSFKNFKATASHLLGTDGIHHTPSASSKHKVKISYYPTAPKAKSYDMQITVNGKGYGKEHFNKEDIHGAIHSSINSFIKKHKPSALVLQSHDKRVHPVHQYLANEINKKHGGKTRFVPEEGSHEVYLK